MQDTRFRLLRAFCVIFLFATPAAVQAACNVKGWFGALSCEYKCHCTNNDCDFTTGECKQGSSCVKGWFGPSCQYVDLMYTNGAPSTPAKLRDGNETTCYDGNSQNVVLSLTEPFTLTWIRLVFGKEDLEVLRSIQVEFSDSTEVCNNKKEINSKVLDVYCEGDGSVQSVILTGSGIQSLCSVHYSGGRNIALNQKATQSSTKDNFVDRVGAAKAVDGNTDGNLNGHSCTHTADNGSDKAPNWKLNFSLPQTISKYVLFNRLDGNEPDCCRNRLKGFTLTSYGSDNSVVFQYQDTESVPQDSYTVLAGPHETTVAVSYVIIKANKSREGDSTPVLTLCEVEMYGDSLCPAGKYGFKCTETCDYCSTAQDTCEVSTGACLSECRPGFYGERCSLACPDRYYGSDCKDRCSENCLNQLCDKVTGACLNCAAGKQGAACQEDCPDKFYGQGCSQPCSTNCVGELCDPVSGSCKTCVSGKKGDMCADDCESKTHGPGCTLPCSDKCLNQLCDPVIGKCYNCTAGKMGDVCETTCGSGTYGSNCKLSCDPACQRNCDPVDGVCTGGCPAGYRGQLCNEKCANGTYGEGCKTDCSAYCILADPKCDHVTGNCTSGCQHGYIAPNCESKQSDRTGTSGEDSVPIAAIIGAVVGGVVLVALIVAGILVWRRRTRNKNETPNTNNKAKRASGPRMKDNSSSSRSRSELIQETHPYDTTRNSQSPDTADRNTASTSGKPQPPGENKSKIPKPGAYYNTSIAEKSSGTLIAVKDLDMFLKTQPKSFYVKQFQSIPDNKNATTKIAESDVNRAKNRYKNICAYDHSRVELCVNKGKKHGDYINASYLEGYKAQEKFIASQAPTKLIMEDFIRMLWEQKVEIVVMLTNLIEQGKQKCEQYWPDEGEIRIGEIKVEITTTDVIADYTIRRLYLSKEGEGGHLLTQFHFTSWPDKDVPTTPWGLVDFEQRVASYQTDKPIVVHCSAGVGRTGTFIALRNVMKEAEDTGYVDFFATVQKLRNDRVNMVQTAEQYEFLHRAAQVAIVCMGTTVTSSDIQKRIAKLNTTSSSGETFMEKEFKAICTTCAEEDDAVSEEASDTKESSDYENSNVANKLKDRLRNIPAKENYRARLNCENDEVGSYINAVFVPSFIKDDGQLLSQLPLPKTVTDFWRMVTQYKVSLVVAFELDLKATDSSIGDYMPTNKDETLEVPLFKVTVGSLSSGDVFEQQTVTVAADESSKRRKSAPGFVDGEHRLIHLKARQVDLTPDNLLAMIKQIRSHNRGNNGRTVYLCRNGATYSGLVCVLTLLLDRMDHDLRLTVPLVVGAIKSIRPQVIPTLEQYKLLYQVLHLYNETNNVYGNLGQPTGGDAGASVSNREPDNSDRNNERTEYANV